MGSCNNALNTPAGPPNKAALECAKKLALMIVPRTATIQNAAKKGKRFSRIDLGQEYNVPKIHDPHNANNRPGVEYGDGAKCPIPNDIINATTTVMIAFFRDNIPAAIGKYGLLILSISTSVI